MIGAMGTISIGIVITVVGWLAIGDLSVIQDMDRDEGRQRCQR